MFTNESNVLCYYLPVTVVSFASIFVSVLVTLLPPCAILTSACGMCSPTQTHRSDSFSIWWML